MSIAVEIVRSISAVSDALFGGLFYKDSGKNSSTEFLIYKAHKEIERLEQEKVSLAQISDPEALAAATDAYIRKNIDAVLSEKFDESGNFLGSVDKLLVKRLDDSIEKVLDTYIQNLDAESVVNAKVNLEYTKKDLANSERLEEFIETERGSVGRLKSVMVNLFIIFNISILIGFFLFGDSIKPHAAYSIAASYLSLAAFIIYIVRTSHFRTGVLLSIRENMINHSSVYRYVESSKCGSPLSEHDVEVIRMMTTNRTEREHQAKHPYEIILKQVEGSNIQFKGGKMQLGKRENEV